MKTNYNRHIAVLTGILSALLALTLAAECLAGEISYENGTPKLFFWSSLYDCFDGGNVSEVKTTDEVDRDGTFTESERPVIKFRIWEAVKEVF